jgi:nicotinate phosphoribosyltransferase
VGASNDLDEIAIDDLLLAGAPIRVFGVGTQLGTSGDAPALGIVFKLVEQEVEGAHSCCMKLAPGKQTDPGRHRVWRRREDRQLVLALWDEDLSADHELLTRTFMTEGEPHELDTLDDARERLAAELDHMPVHARFGHGATPLTLARTAALWALRARLGDSEAVQGEPVPA